MDLSIPAEAGGNIRRMAPEEFEAATGSQIGLRLDADPDVVATHCSRVLDAPWWHSFAHWLLPASAVAVRAGALDHVHGRSAVCWHSALPLVALLRASGDVEVRRCAPGLYSGASDLLVELRSVGQEPVHAMAWQPLAGAALALGCR